MATDRNEIEQLIRNADAAGDADAVRVLFAELDKLEQPKRFGTGRSLDVMADGSMVPTESVDYTARNEENRSELSKVGQALKNVGESGAHIATAVPAGLLADVAGLGALGYDITANAIMHPFSGAEPGAYADPTAVRDAIANHLTYQPEDPESLSMKAVTAPGRILMGGGEALAQNFDNPYVQDVVRAVPLAAASAMGVKAARPATVSVAPNKLGNVGGKEPPPQLSAGSAPRSAPFTELEGQTVRVPVPEKFEPVRIPGKTPEERAKRYVESRTNLDWNSINQAFRQRLIDIAKEGKRLENLDATAVERQSVLATLERPITDATRGQLTRNPNQQRKEQLLKATDAGRELVDIDLTQNARLLENIDALTQRQGARAATPLQTGQSVQGAARQLEAQSKGRYESLYRKARETEPNAQASIKPVTDLLTENPQIQHLGWVQTWLNKAAKAAGGKEGEPHQLTHATLNELDDLRKLSQKYGGGTDAHFARELRRAVDTAMDEVPEGAAAWKAARESFKAHRAEFANQSAVAKLVKSKRGTTDRAVALEDTWDSVVKNGSVEDWGVLSKTLEKTAEGKQALADLRAETARYIRNKATRGESGLKNERGELNVEWGRIKNAVDDIGDEKLVAIFGKQDAARIRAIVDSAQILKTEAPMNIKGSPTFDKALTFLDGLGKVPGLGTASTIGKLSVKAAGKLRDIGKAGKDLRDARSSPLDDGAP